MEPWSQRFLSTEHVNLPTVKMIAGPLHVQPEARVAFHPDGPAVGTRGSRFAHEVSFCGSTRQATRALRDVPHSPKVLRVHYTGDMGPEASHPDLVWQRPPRVDRKMTFVRLAGLRARRAQHILSGHVVVR